MKIAGAGGSLGGEGLKEAGRLNDGVPRARVGTVVGETDEEASRASQAMRGAHHTHTGHLCPRAALITNSDGHILVFPWTYSL